MDKQPRSRVPLILAIALLLLPVLYGGSYLALVRRGGIPNDIGNDITQVDYYRAGGAYSEAIFSPLEALDRWIQPDAWWKPLDPADPKIRTSRLKNYPPATP
jgi:hypothetical protein